MRAFMIAWGFLFVAVSAQAHQVEWVRHSFFGTEQIVIKYDSKKSLLFTNNNSFSGGNPARVGFFEIKGPASQSKIVDSVVADASSQKSAKKIFTSPHVAKIFLNGKEVPVGSKAYELLLQAVATEAQEKNWKFVDGQQVTFTNFKDIAIKDWKNGRLFTSRTREPASVCKTRANDVGCLLPSGIVYAPSGFAYKPTK